MTELKFPLSAKLAFGAIHIYDAAGMHVMRFNESEKPLVDLIVRAVNCHEEAMEFLRRFIDEPVDYSGLARDLLKKMRGKPLPRFEDVRGILADKEADDE